MNNETLGNILILVGVIAAFIGVLGMPIMPMSAIEVGIPEFTEGWPMMSTGLVVVGLVLAYFGTQLRKS